MKRYAILLALCVFLASCSSPSKEPQSAATDYDENITAESDISTASPSPETGLVDSGIVQPGRAFLLFSSFRDPENDGIVYCIDDRYTYELHARGNGYFVNLNHTELHDDFVIEGSGTAYWSISYVEPRYTFIDILIKEGDRYVGYAVVSVQSDIFYNGDWTPHVLDCMALADGDTETVLTPEYLREQIDKAIEKYGPYILELYAPDEE